MPRNLPDELLGIKNRIEDGNPWLVLLDVVIPLETPITLYLVNNRDNVFFGTPPQEYTAFPFEISLPPQIATGEIPRTSLTINDVDKSIRRYIDDLNGGYGTTVTLRVVHAESLLDAADYAELTIYFDLLEATAIKESITFTLGAPNLMRQAFPPGRYMASHCMWASRYGGYECKLPLTGNSGNNRTTFPHCDGSLTACKLRSNTVNYGGHPGLSDYSMKVI
jgi:phage-related protein